MSSAPPPQADAQTSHGISTRPLAAGLLVFLAVGVAGLAVWLANRGTPCSSPSLPIEGLPSCASVEAWAIAGFIAFIGGLLTTVGLILHSLRKPRAVASKSRMPGGWVGWAVAAVAVTVVMAGVLGGSVYASQPGAPGTSSQGPASTQYRSVQTATLPAGQRQPSEADTSFSFPASYAGYGGGWLNLTFSSSVAVGICLETAYLLFNESYSLCTSSFGSASVTSANNGTLSVSSEGGAVVFDAVSVTGVAANVSFAWTDVGSVDFGSITTQATGSGILPVSEGAMSLGAACVTFELPANNQSSGTLFVNATSPVSASAAVAFGSGCSALAALLSFGSASGTSVSLAISDDTGLNGSFIGVSLAATSASQASATVTLVAEDTAI